MTGGPNALNDEGMLAGGEHLHRAAERACWRWAGHDGDFTGHLFAKTDFTGCRGVGWVTDFGSVNQAYLPYFGDNLDDRWHPCQHQHDAVVDGS